MSMGQGCACRAAPLGSISARTCSSTAWFGCWWSLIALAFKSIRALSVVVAWYSLAEIAPRLSVSPRTAETHRTNLMRKLGLHSQTDLIRFAIRRGILPLEN